MKIEDRYISVFQMAKLLNISRIAVFKRIKNGQINAVKAGRNYIISRKEVENILSKKINNSTKKEISRAVKKVVNKYGSTLKKFGKE